MRNFLESLAGSSDFMPHGYCLVWEPGLVWLHVGSDVLTGLSYFLIAGVLFYLVNKRRDLPFFWMFFLFGTFILACGTTHLMAAWTIYVPSYWLEGFIKTATAALSVATAIWLLPLLPKMLNLPNLSRALDENRQLNQQLLNQINTLHEEVNKRQEAEAELLLDHEILSNMHDGVYLLRANDGVIVFANQQFERMFGYEPGEIIGKHVSIVNAPTEMNPRETATAIMSELQAHGIWRGEVKNIKKDGTLFWSEASVTSLTVAGSEYGAVWVAVHRDITARKQAEEKLRASEARVASFGTHFTAGMIYQVVVQEDGTRTFTYVSDSVRLLHGMSPEEAMADARLIYSRVYADDIKVLTEAENEALRTFSTFHAEVRMMGPSGEMRWSSLVSTPRNLEDGSICWDGIELDITSRKQAEESLVHVSMEWLAAMDASADVICLLDLNRHLVRANKTFYLATGTTPENAIGRHIVEVVHPQGEATPCPVCLAQEEKRDLLVVMEGDHPDNPVGKPIEISVKIIHDHVGRPLSILMTLHDLSAVRQAMEEKAALERQLQQAQKMESVGRLAGGVAHDFNNMLGVIIGHAELALDRVEPGQQLHADLTEIHKAALRSAELTRQLLAFARKQTVVPKVLDLNDTVAGMLKMLQRLIGENIKLNWRPGAPLWPVLVDPSQIDQILANLCVNARDAILDVGEISIETECSTLDEDYCASHSGVSPGEYVRLTVSDNGRGMDQATLTKIFEPFFTTKGVGKGTGLGLATVYGAVKQNHGSVNVYSEPGQGTTFTIYLPRYTGQAERAQAEVASLPGVRGQETILLVEDEAAILQMTTRMLAGLGYTVLAASTPGEAIRLAREHTGEISLLMTDVVMPEMNGRDLARNLLSLYPNLKRLFMSGYTADVIAHRGVLDEGVHFIQKPFSIKDLAAKVREVLAYVD